MDAPEEAEPPAVMIAEIAGCPEATVWRRLHYARKTFRASIEKAWETRE